MKRTLLLVFSSLVIGFASLGIQFQAARPSALARSVADFNNVQAEFLLLDNPVKFSGSNNYSANIKIQAFEKSGESLAISARGKIRGDKHLASFSRGESYRCLLALSPTAAGERAGFESRCVDEPERVASAQSTDSLVLNLRGAFMRHLRGVDEDSAGLVAGLAIGDVSRLSPELQENMKLVSLTHLTAVSGANCAIVLAMFYLLVRRLGGGRWARLFIGLLALIGYVYLVGAQPSVLRAAVMSAAVLIGISIGRKTAPLSALGLSVIFLLVADPWLAIDFGFALSVAATAGLLILTKPLADRLERVLPKWLAIALAVSIAAQIFCLPILLQLQDGLATYSLPANVLAEPLVAPVTVLGIIACLFGWVFPPAAWVCTFTASLGTWLITQIAQGFANSAHATLAWPVGVYGAVLAIGVIIAFLLWLRAEPTQLRNLGLICITLIFSASLGSIGFSLLRSANWPGAEWFVVACDVGQGDALVIRSAGKVAVIDVGRDSRPIDTCLDRLHIRKIDLLVLTHFDMDHIGGLRGAISQREVSVAMVSPFKDERWGATGTNLLLLKSGIKTIAAEKGMTGNLGAIQWQVISPNRYAAGAEDSNDASIVILWSAREFNILTMADIGEKGQMRITQQESWCKEPSLHESPLILKVSHHGSADQYGELLEELKPDVSLISVGKANSYGHPTARTLGLLKAMGSKIYRTDELGSISLESRQGALVLAHAPRS